MTSIGCFLLVLVINLTIGGFATQYLIEHWLHKTVSFALCALIGVFGGELIIPAAVVTWLLVVTGVI